MTVEELADIHASAFQYPRPWSSEEFAALLASPYTVLVEAVQGFALGRVVAGEAELLTIAVRPDARRQGVGSRLLSDLIEAASERSSTWAASSTSRSTKPPSTAPRSSRPNRRHLQGTGDAERSPARTGAAPSSPKRAPTRSSMTGFAWGDVLNQGRPRIPDTKFAIIDMVVDLPNVQSVVFNEHEGSYLVGMMAAMASKSGTVGFVGGMDIPLIRKFGCGYAQGVKAVPTRCVKVVQNMTGTTPAAWNDPVKGGELAKARWPGRGRDLCRRRRHRRRRAAGRGRRGILSIGVDSNQNHLHPGKVLTSMLKRVDNAVYNAFKEGDGTFKPGIKVMAWRRKTASAMRWTTTTPAW
jgi:GNAT superfamily N-acetyltransferase